MTKLFDFIPVAITYFSVFFEVNGDETFQTVRTKQCGTHSSTGIKASVQFFVQQTDFSWNPIPVDLTFSRCF